ncbi:MAG: hypothetical protein LBD23_04645 [Oscillospiraceae bacterium]|jgi:hypothetical protein|nr:hypothetical protein [Oscillospiraceae bacterium]
MWMTRKFEECSEGKFEPYTSDFAIFEQGYKMIEGYGEMSVNNKNKADTNHIVTYRLCND